MTEIIQENKQWHRGWNGNSYTCADMVEVSCRREILSIKLANSRDRWTVPRNGVWLRPNVPLVVDATGTVTNRHMTEVVSGGSCREYALPRSAKVVGQCAFQERSLESARLNEGLEKLEKYCFQASEIRLLVLPESVRSIGP